MSNTGGFGTPLRPEQEESLRRGETMRLRWSAVRNLGGAVRLEAHLSGVCAGRVTYGGPNSRSWSIYVTLPGGNELLGRLCVGMVTFDEDRAKAAVELAVAEWLTLAGLGPKE